MKEMTIRKRKYLLDACVPMGVSEFLSSDYLRSCDIIPHNAPDEMVLKIADKRRRLVITMDYLFIIRTICKNKEIVFQSRDGRRILLIPQLIEENCSPRSIDNRTQFLLKNNEIIIP